MSNATHTTLTRTKSRSPLLRAWRWASRQVHRQALAADIINNADLPKPIAQRINTITRRTRLWPTERAEIARELIAHARDALEAGRNTDTVLSALGDPKTVAKLLRRSAKRKRSWLWQLRRWTTNAILCTLGLMLLTYAALFIRFNTGSPEIKRHYIAELNQRNAAYTTDQHAWPAVEALWIQRNMENRRVAALHEQQRDESIQNGTFPAIPSGDPVAWAIDMHRDATPEHSGYDEFLVFLKRIEPEIEAVARAAHLPTIGGLYSDRNEEVTIEGVPFTLIHPLPPTERAEDSGSMISVLLPWLGQFRTASRVLLTDATFAARAGDADRVFDRVEACARLGTLLADEGFLISYLVATAIQVETETALLDILSEHPDLFSDEQLTALSHRVSSTSAHSTAIDMTLERNMIADTLQRTFTDDGNGDGRLTASGFEDIASEILPLKSDFDRHITVDGTTQPTAVGRLLGPTSLVTVASRREHQDAYDHLIRYVEDALDENTSPPESIALMAEMDEAFMEIVYQPHRFPILGVLMPALGHSVQTVQTARAHTDATLLAIAAHVHHRRTGAWPTDASELVPHLLPSIPEDPFNPGQPYRMIVRDGKLIVYSLGADGDDDQGTLEPNEAGFVDVGGVRNLGHRYRSSEYTKNTITDGDWIIYPPLN